MLDRKLFFDKTLYLRQIWSRAHYRICTGNKIAMNRLHIKDIEQCAADAGIRVSLHGAEILKMIIELRSNGEILEYMQRRYGIEWRGAAQKRKFNVLLQGFIMYNYFDRFTEYCENNSITIFNSDLETEKGDSTYARFIFISFLREEAGFRHPIEIIV